jgi:hypothetical protein
LSWIAAANCWVNAVVRENKGLLPDNPQKQSWRVRHAIRPRD